MRLAHQTVASDSKRHHADSLRLSLRYQNISKADILLRVDLKPKLIQIIVSREFVQPGKSVHSSIIHSVVSVLFSFVRIGKR